MARLISLLLLGAALLLPVTNASDSRADNSDEVQAVNDVLAIRGLSIELWRGGIGTSEPAAEQARRLLQTFNMDIIASVVAGPHWSRANVADRSDFTDALQNVVLESLVSRLGRFNQESFDVIGVRQLPSGDLVVSSRLAFRDHRVFVIDWRFRKTALRFQVIDVATDGRSMTTQKREEFAARGNVEGGTLADLTNALRARKSRFGEPR